MESELRHLQHRLRACRLCPDVQGPVVVGAPVPSPVLLVGQAPGVHEGEAGRPFAWTAGRTLFRWFASIDLEEPEFRQRVYMAAVCRCFPGKHPKGGDRVPAPVEVANCSRWLDAELAILKPDLILPVGKLAIGRFLTFHRLQDVIGRVHRLPVKGRPTDIIPLPHPSGASTWHRTEPGRTLLADALAHTRIHPAWQRVIEPRFLS